jgi:DNA polymerase III delta prime subunit
MADWRDEVRKLYDPRKGGIKLKNVFILHGDTIAHKTYGSYRTPVCDMYEAVITEYEKDFDIIAYYTDNDGEKRKRGLNFYKGKDIYLSLCENPPEPSRRPVPPPKIANNNYAKSRYNRHYRGFAKSVEEGKKDRLSREATYYDKDPNQMVEHLDRNLFGKNEHKALIIFDDWLYWSNRLFFKDPDHQSQRNTKILNIFRRWARDETLPNNHHLLFVIASRDPADRGDDRRSRTRTEEIVESIFSLPNCISIPVDPLSEKNIRDALLSAHFKSDIGFRLTDETEAEKIAALLHENGLVTRDGLKIITGIAAVNKQWDAGSLSQELGLKLSSNVKPLEEMSETQVMDRMKEYVVGQDEAIAIITKKMRNAVRSRAPRKGPIEKFMLVGPTGVGKTETAKALAYALTGDSKDFIFFSANEYPGDESVWAAFGPTPGYRGFQDEMRQTGGGMLTKPLIQNPKKRLIILIDEIEKTSETFRNALFALLDEGLADDRSAQRKVSFKNCVIIGTSNFADRAIAAYMATKPDIRNAQAEAKRILIQAGMPSPFLGRWTLIPYTYPPVEALRQILVKNIRAWGTAEEKIIERIDERYLDSILQKHADLPSGIRGIIDEAKFDIFDRILDCEPDIPYFIDEGGRITSV